MAFLPYCRVRSVWVKYPRFPSPVLQVLAGRISSVAAIHDVGFSGVLFVFTTMLHLAMAEAETLLGWDMVELLTVQGSRPQRLIFRSDPTLYHQMLVLLAASVISPNPFLTAQQEGAAGPCDLRVHCSLSWRNKSRQLSLLVCSFVCLFACKSGQPNN